MGSKRPRPWSLQTNGSSGSVAVAAAAFALAALSLPEAGALSGSCATGRSDSSRTSRWGDSGGGNTCVADRRERPARRRKARLVLSSSSGGSGHVRARSSSSSGSHVRSVSRQSSPPAVLPLAGDHEDGIERNGSRGGVRLRGGSVAPPISAIPVAHVLEPPPRPPASRHMPRPAASSSNSNNSSSSSSSSTHKSKAIKAGHRWKSDNDVRMFLMERGLSQWEVRKVLPVMRRDPELVNDVATLAARMQAIADLLEAAVSWYSPEGEAATGVPDETVVADAVEHARAAPLADGGGGSVTSASTPTELRSEDARSWNRNGRQEEGGAGRPIAPAAAPAASEWLAGGGGSSKQGEDAKAEEMAAMRSYGGVDDDRDRNGEEHRATPPSTAAARVENATSTAPAADRAEGEGPRLHAYQLVSSEPRLLLLRAEPDLSNRLRFLLDMLPGLRRGYWNGRLRRAAPLLAIDTVKLQRRSEGLVEMFPDHVDLQAVLNQAPLLLRHRTETVTAALANIERLVPGLRVDRLLRSAPYVLVQPLNVVEKRLSHLRNVLGLTPSPELEKMRIAIGPIQRSGSGDGTGRQGRGGRQVAGVRTLARFANAFPQILTMEPHTIQAKIEGLEELLPGMDGLAVVSSRPHLLGFSVRQNVSLKVSGLRALMKRESAGPEESRQEQHQHHQHQHHQQASATAGNDLAAAVTRCPSLLTLSSETAARKVEELQEALPPGLDARAVVAKEPRVLALDTASTVPRKLDGLTRALAVHAPPGGGDSGGDVDEAVAAAAAQVLRYYPNALRLDPATLAGKLDALRTAGLSPETVLSVVGGAPRCLSAAAGTLERRVSMLKEAFPSICVDGLLGQAPGLLQNRIDPGARVKVLQELFPSLSPLRLVEGAPMLLALSESTLRAKAEAWRDVLEARVEQPWEQVVVEFPQLLCQGLGRAARVAFLLSDSSASDDGDAAVAAGRAVVVAVETRTMSAANACREVCRRVADFESDHPSYPAFLDALLLAARCQRAGGALVAGVARGDHVVREREECPPNSPASLLAPERGVSLGGVALNHADVGGLAGNQRQPNQPHARPRATTPTTTAPGTQPAGDVPNRHSRMAAQTPSLGNRGQRQQQPLPGAPSASPTPVVTPAEEVRIAVTSEKALGAAMTAAAKGPGGGREAAAMLVLHRKR